jgi:geranylgeranyl pyrophosphate synthase
MNIELKMNEMISRSSFHPEMKNVLSYATLPAGKLFRPHLGIYLDKDLNQSQNLSSNLLWWLTAIEFHHAYSLVHDDMPCMDDDDMRRGKPSTHKFFGEWKALLAGDSLIIESIRNITQINSPYSPLLMKIFLKATGPNGLILGQWIDLSLEAQNNFSLLIRMHELKTSRLMQLSLLGTWILATRTPQLKDAKEMLKLGSSIGLLFQLFDDLDDYFEAPKDSHEAKVNPFSQFPKLCFEELIKNIDKSNLILKNYKLNFLQSYIKTFIDQSTKSLETKTQKAQELWPQCKNEINYLISKNIFA